MQLDFKGNFIIKANLVCLTGLHIGGSKESFEIGGLDNPVIKVPIDIKLKDGRVIKEGMPYIPGSSLKGKIRSLLEWKYGLVEIDKQNNGKIKSKFKVTDENNNINSVGKVFGVGVSDLKNINLVSGPTRVKFFDSYPTKETIKNWKEKLGEGIYTEVKIENAIDRITAMANPRQQERVPAGSEFEVEIMFEVLEDEDFKRFKIVLEGMRLLEDNYLGGGGTRGNGRVMFKDITIAFRSKKYYEGKSEEIIKGEFQSVEEALKKDYGV
ncbi:MAG: type III-A CRISPR-associated RAMP protein Csm3 [Sulfurihydrogenibium sp.]|nr:MAG: type III-A CRISPR-associated RAMP protein Csm3 [Sulfurihydrogenibium sp.]